MNAIGTLAKVRTTNPEEDVAGRFRERLDRERDRQQDERRPGGDVDRKQHAA